MEGLYYLCSENNGADQLCVYREADLRLCFCICKMLVFSCQLAPALNQCFLITKNVLNLHFPAK